MSPNDEASQALSLTVTEMAELAGGLAHELRNPLSTMMVNLKLLTEDLRDPGADIRDARRRALRRVDVLRHEAERLKGLFDDFLSTTGPCRLDRKPVDLGDLADRLVQFFEPLARSYGIELTARTDEAPASLPADEELLSQALLNLLINAQEAMPDGGRLTIDIRREGDEALIAVSDTGVGIGPENRDRIMRPFFSTKGTGTGLGLSVTRRIIHEHGGTISFASEPGRGTEFTVRLPLTTPEDPV